MSSARCVKKILPLPRFAMSSMNLASESFFVPSPMTEMVAPWSVISLSSFLYCPGSTESAASVNRMMCLVPMFDFLSLSQAYLSPVYTKIPPPMDLTRMAFLVSRFLFPLMVCCLMMVSGSESTA